MRHRSIPFFCLWAIAGLLLSCGLAHGQTPINITVLGVGKLAWDVPLPPAQAQAQVYKAYLPSDGTTASTLTTTCTATASGSQCAAPLSELNLQTGVSTSLALTATVTAADGEVESNRVVAPFVLTKAGPPAEPTYSATPIRPPSP
jgi:hypothetical protein